MCKRRKVDAVEIRCLPRICGIRRTDRISNVEIRRICHKNVRIGEKNGSRCVEMVWTCGENGREETGKECV